MAAVRRKKVALLGADADVVNGCHAGLLQLGTVRCREIQEQPVTSGPSQESGFEPRSELRPDLVAAAAYAGADPGDNVLAAVLVAHEIHSGPRDARTCSAPARVDQSHRLLLCVPQ